MLKCYSKMSPVAANKEWIVGRWYKGMESQWT